jgi:hypothetical protein
MRGRGGREGGRVEVRVRGGGRGECTDLLGR